VGTKEEGVGERAGLIKSGRVFLSTTEKRGDQGKRVIDRRESKKKVKNRAVRGKKDMP